MQPLHDWHADLRRQWADAKVAAGQHDEVIRTLRGLTRTDPFDERLWAALVLALHQAGRQAEALDAYREWPRCSPASWASRQDHDCGEHTGRS